MPVKCTVAPGAQKVAVSGLTQPQSAEFGLFFVLLLQQEETFVFEYPHTDTITVSWGSTSRKTSFIGLQRRIAHVLQESAIQEYGYQEWARIMPVPVPVASDVLLPGFGVDDLE